MGAAELLEMDVGIKPTRVEPKAMPWIDSRLRRWAECLPCAFDDGGEGVRVSGSLQASFGNSVLAGVIAAKGIVIRSTADSPSIPDDVYEVDKAMRKLEQDKPVLFQVVFEHYQHADAVEEVRIARCGCSRRTYFRRLAQGHGVIAFLLPGKSKSAAASVRAGSSARDRLLKKIKNRA